MLNTLLLMLRSFCFSVGYYLVTIVYALLFIILYPVLPARGRYLFATSWCGFVISWLRLCCGVRFKIEGRENLPDEPIVIIANHQSSWETILLYKLVFPVSPILKKELMNIPFWGWAMRLQKPIAIDRSNPRGAGRSLLVQGVERIKSGNSVIVFPEGTRMQTGNIKRFSRSGAKLAMAAGTDIVPIAHNAGYCWPPRKFIKYPGLITVVVGERRSTKDGDASEITNEIEDWIRRTVAKMV